MRGSSASVSSCCVWKRNWVSGRGHRDDVSALLQSFTKDKGQAGLDAAWSEYTSQWGPSPSQDQMKITAVEVGTDNYFLVAVQTAIYLHAAAAR